MQEEYYECLISSPRHYANLAKSERHLLNQQEQFQHTLGLCERLSATLMQLQNDYNELHTSFSDLNNIVSPSPSPSTLSPPPVHRTTSSRRETVTVDEDDALPSNGKFSHQTHPFSSTKSPLSRMSHVLKEQADLCQLWRAGVLRAIEEIHIFLRETRCLSDLRKKVKHSAESWEAAQLKSAALSSATSLKTKSSEEAQTVVDSSMRTARITHWTLAFELTAFLRISRILAQQQGVKTMSQLIEAFKDHAYQSKEFMSHVYPWLEQAKEQEQSILDEKDKEMKLKKEAEQQCTTLFKDCPTLLITPPQTNTNSYESILVEGYLQYKKSWRQWCRRWFQIRNNQLIYYKPVSLSAAPSNLPSRPLSVVQYGDFKESEVSHTSNQASQSSVKSRPMSPASRHSTRIASGMSEMEKRNLRASSPEYRILVPDLRLCTARMPPETCERRWAFEIVLASRETYLLQAYSEEERYRWMEVLKEGMMAISQDHMIRPNGCTGMLTSGNKDQIHSPKASRRISVLSSSQEGVHSPDLSARKRTDTRLSVSSQQSTPTLASNIPEGNATQRLNQRIQAQRAMCAQRILQVSGNQRCCDCGSEKVRWAALNLGVTLCDLCSGVHRTLFSPPKVRSLTLDHWEPASLRLMLTLGNDRVNSVYEARTEEVEAAKLTYLEKSASQTVPHKISSDSRLTWLTYKWLEKRYIRSVIYEDIADNYGASLTQRANLLLWNAIRERRVVDMLAALAQGARVNDVTNTNGVTPLMLAVKRPSLAATEFLLVNGAHCNATDNFGRSALHYAASHERLQQVCLLLKRGADPSLPDKQSSTPLDVALRLQNAHIVTLLRLRVLRDDSPTPGSGSGGGGMASSSAAAGDDPNSGYTCPSSVDLVNDVFRDFTSEAYDQLTDEEEDSLTTISDDEDDLLTPIAASDSGYMNSTNSIVVTTSQTDPEDIPSHPRVSYF